jgi:hypothetical protein
MLSNAVAHGRAGSGAAADGRAGGVKSMDFPGWHDIFIINAPDLGCAERRRKSAHQYF